MYLLISFSKRFTNYIHNPSSYIVHSYTVKTVLKFVSYLLTTCWTEGERKGFAKFTIFPFLWENLSHDCELLNKLIFVWRSTRPNQLLLYYLISYLIKSCSMLFGFSLVSKKINIRTDKKSHQPWFWSLYSVRI